MDRRRGGGLVRQRGRVAGLAQGWKVNVGFDNFTRVLTNDTIRESFLRIVVWNFAFAIGTVVITFALGLLVAIALNNPLLRGRTLYRSLIILPYAMPSLAMYLVWREMFNTDFGLINRVLGTDINWFGTTASSMFAVLLIQLWLGYNYMFLVITGALQSISSDLVEAAGVDGAKPFYAFRTITFPLLLVALAPLLITSFAFNFNNFPAIYLTSRRRSVPAGQPERRWHRPADHLHLPARVRRLRSRLRLRRRHLGVHLPDRRDRLDRGLPSHPGPGGDQLMTHTTSEAITAQTAAGSEPPEVVRHGSAKGGWFRRTGFSHLVGVLSLIFSLFPILFVVSASLQPGRHPELVEPDPAGDQPGQLPDPLRRVLPTVVRQQPGRRVAGCRDLDVHLRLRGVRVLALPLHRAAARRCSGCCSCRCSRSSWRSSRCT